MSIVYSHKVIELLSLGAVALIALSHVIFEWLESTVETYHQRGQNPSKWLQITTGRKFRALWKAALFIFVLAIVKIAANGASNPFEAWAANVKEALSHCKYKGDSGSTSWSCLLTVLEENPYPFRDNKDDSRFAAGIAAPYLLRIDEAKETLKRCLSITPHFVGDGHTIPNGEKGRQTWAREYLIPNIPLDPTGNYLPAKGAAIVGGATNALLVWAGSSRGLYDELDQSKPNNELFRDFLLRLLTYSSCVPRGNSICMSPRPTLDGIFRRVVLEKNENQEEEFASRIALWSNENFGSTRPEIAGLRVVHLTEGVPFSGHLGRIDSAGVFMSDLTDIWHLKPIDAFKATGFTAPIDDKGAYLNGKGTYLIWLILPTKDDAVWATWENIFNLNPHSNNGSAIASANCPDLRQSGDPEKSYSALNETGSSPKMTSGNQSTTIKKDSPMPREALSSQIEDAELKEDIIRNIKTKSPSLNWENAQFDQIAFDNFLEIFREMAGMTELKTVSSIYRCAHVKFEKNTTLTCPELPKLVPPHGLTNEADLNSL